jgi:hypothetical protein
MLTSHADGGREDVNALMDYMSNPDSMNASSIHEWWACQDEMKVTRDDCKSGIRRK